MALPQLLTVTVPIQPGERPRDADLDLFGLTHPGKVRHENQDHFLLATLHRQLMVYGTSLPDRAPLLERGERLATLLLVADGVGGGIAGGEASRLAAETVTRYVTSTMQCLHKAGPSEDREFFDALRGAALEAHEAVKTEGTTRVSSDGEPVARGMATTLTLGIAVWPWFYVVQVGDSRCYHYWDGVLTQVTRDQTIAQDLVDRGVLTPERAATSPFSRILASAIGGGEAVPVVSRLDIRQRGCVVLLCSDGLTTHVTNEEIAERLSTMQSSEHLCRSLLDLALERGGTDNVTILAGRARAARPSLEP
jgi:serine/threonine protein phosphatase PrpC